MGCITILNEIESKRAKASAENRWIDGFIYLNLNIHIYRYLFIHTLYEYSDNIHAIEDV